MTKPSMKGQVDVHTFLAKNHIVGSAGERRPNGSKQWKGPAGPHGTVLVLELPIVNKGRSSLWEQVGKNLKKKVHIKDMHEYAMCICLYLAVAGVVPPWEQPCGNRGGAVENGAAGSDNEEEDDFEDMLGSLNNQCKIWVQLLFTENGDKWGYRLWFFGPVGRDGGVEFDANVAVKKVLNYANSVGTAQTFKAMGNMFEKPLRGDSRHYQGLLYYILHAYLTQEIVFGCTREKRLIECMQNCVPIPNWDGTNKTYFLSKTGENLPGVVCVDVNSVFSPESCKTCDKVVAEQRDPTTYFVRGTDGGVDFNAPEDQTGLYGPAEELMISPLLLGEVPEQPNKSCMMSWSKGGGLMGCRSGRGTKDDDFSMCMPFDLKRPVYSVNNDYVKFYIRWRELLNNKCEFLQPTCTDQQLRELFPEFVDVRAMLRVFIVATLDNEESVQFADMEEDKQYRVLQLILVNTEVCLQTEVCLYASRVFECFQELDCEDARQTFTAETSVCYQVMVKWYAKCCDIANRNIYDAYCAQRQEGSRPRKLWEQYMDPTREHHFFLANRIVRACEPQNWFVGMSKLSNLAGGAYADWVDNVRMHAETRRILHNFGPLLAMSTTFANAGNSDERLKFWGILYGPPGSGKSNTAKAAAMFHGGNVYSETDTTEKAKTSHGYAAYTNGDINLQQELQAFFQEGEQGGAATEKILQWQKICCGEACAFARSIQDPVTGKQIFDEVISRFVGGSLACTNIQPSQLPKPVQDRAYTWESSNNPNARVMLHMAADQNVPSDPAFLQWQQINLDWKGLVNHGYIEYQTTGVLPCGVGMPSESTTSDYVRSRQPAKMDMAIAFLDDVCTALHRNTGIQMLPLPPRYQDLYVNALYTKLAMASLEHSQGLAGYYRYIVDKDVKAACCGSIGTFFMKVKEAYAWELHYTHCVAAVGSLLPGWIARAMKKSSDVASSSKLSAFVKQDLVLRRVFNKRCDVTPHCLQLSRHTQLVNTKGRDVCTKPCPTEFGSVNRLVWEQNDAQDGPVLVFGSDSKPSEHFDFHMLLSDTIDTCYCCGMCGQAKSEGPRTFYLNGKWLPENERIGMCKCVSPVRPKPFSVTTQVPMCPELQTMLEGMKPGGERIVIASSSWLSGTLGYGSLQPASQQIVYLFLKRVGDATADDTILLQNLVSQATHTLRKQKLRNEIRNKDHQGAVDPKGIPKNLLDELRIRRDKASAHNPGYTKIGDGDARALANRISAHDLENGGNHDPDSILEQITAATCKQFTAEGTIIGLDGKSLDCTVDVHKLPSAGLVLCLRQLSVNDGHVSSNYGGLVCKNKRWVVQNATNGACYHIKEVFGDGRFELYAQPMQLTYDTSERGFPVDRGKPKDVLAIFPTDTTLQSVNANTIVSYVDHQGTRHDKHIKECGLKWFQKRLDEHGDQMVSMELGQKVQDVEKLTTAQLSPLIPDINIHNISLQELTDSISEHYNTPHLLEIKELKPSHAADSYVSVGECVLPVIAVRDCVRPEWENPTSQPAFVLVNERGMQPSGRKNESIGGFELHMSTQLMMNMLATRTTNDDVSVERKVFDALQDVINQLPPQFMVEKDTVGDEQLQTQIFSSALCSQNHTTTETGSRRRTAVGQTVFVSTTSRVFVYGDDLCCAEHLLETVNNTIDKTVLTAHGVDPECTCHCSPCGEFTPDDNCPLGFTPDVLCPGDRMNLNNFTHSIVYDPTKHVARIQSNHRGIPTEFCTDMEAFKVFPQDRTHDASGKTLFPYPLDVATFYQQPTLTTSSASKVTPAMGTTWSRDTEGCMRPVTDIAWTNGDTNTHDQELITRLHVPCSSIEEAITNKADIQSAATSELAAAYRHGGVELARKMVRNFGGSSRPAHVAASKDMQIANGWLGSRDTTTSASTNDARKRKLRDLFCDY